MATPDLSKLSDEELDAAIELLGERTQELTNTVAVIRAEKQRRQLVAETPTQPPPVDAEALAAAVTGAPERAKANAAAAEEAARVAAEEAAAANAPPEG